MKRIKEFKRKYPKGKIVLITHAPPYRTKQDNVYGGYVGAKNIRWFIRDNKLDYCFCGHIHENARTKDKIGKTIVVNPGPKGMIFDV
jgi:Icc-related predicted phosphoesterase